MFNVTKSMDFESACLYLDSLISYEAIKNVPYGEQGFNLERLKKFLKHFGVDYSRLKFIHVGGSKGKGTVSKIISDYFQKTGMKVGLFLSPHFLKVTERIAVSGEEISEQKFCSVLGEVRAVLGTWGGGELTYFEVLFVVALKFFVEQKVDYTILEVGLGGRLDATNIVVPKVAVLTRVELEHTEILGDTLKKILIEKLGIYKDGVALVVGKQSYEGEKLIKGLMKGKNVVFARDVKGFSFKNANKAFEENVFTAFCAIREVVGEVNLKFLEEVCENFRLIGRFDIRNFRETTVVFDMAHTVNSMRNLCETLVLRFPGKSFVFLLSFMKGKDIFGMFEEVMKLSKDVIFTSSHKERGYRGEELKTFLLSNADVEEDLEMAFKKAISSVKKNQVLVVTGSHFLVSCVLQKFF